MRRICLTLFLLPLLCLPLMPVLFLLDAKDPNWMTAVQGLWFGAYAAIGAIPTLLLLGGPLLLLAAWRRWWNAWHFVLGGAVLAAAVPIASALHVLQDEKLHLWYRLENFSVAVPWLVGGLVYGWVFWLVAIWRNPLAASPTVSMSAGVASEGKGAA